MRHWTRSIILCSYYIPIMAAKSTLIPTLDEFKKNRSIIPSKTRNEIIKFKIDNPNNLDSTNVVTKLSAIIGFLQHECSDRTKRDALSIGYRTSCGNGLEDYNNFLTAYNSSPPYQYGGRRKTSKGRRKNNSRTRRNRKSRR